MADLYWVQPSSSTIRGPLATSWNVDVVLNATAFGLDASMLSFYTDALAAATTQEETDAIYAQINADTDIQPTVIAMGWVRASVVNRTASLYGQNLRLVRSAALMLRAAGIIN